VYLVTSEQMQALDRRTIQSRRIPGILLMEHAGKAVAEVVLRKRPKAVVVLCGKGNNGGDGWIAARWLKHWGVPSVTVVTTTDVDSLQGDARQAAEMALAADVPYQRYQPGTSIPPADVYVDALLGTGVSRPLTGELAQLVEALNEAPGWVVSVDVPSGVEASTGRVPGAAVRADWTVAMAAQKVGTAVTPGCLYAGTVEVVDIGIERPCGEEYARLTTRDWIRSLLPSRSDDSHKGTFGKVGVAVGSMQGAAVLAGLGAARSGAGLVVLAGRTLPMAAPYDFVQRQVSSNESPFPDCDSVVVGPGLGTEAAEWLTSVRQHSGPGVIDADGLRLLEQLGTLSDRWVLTPHPKECARLLQWSTDEVQAERIRAAKTLAAATGAVVVLKGYRTILAHPDQRIRVISTGDASLATAGTGDVLAGMIGGFLAQGLDAFDAATAAAHLHGLAGELAGRERSKASVMATDVVEFISRAILLHFDREPEESL
jgi:hydroxyethylthiazole kinase-like uncharacterized protein yjeF